MDIVSNLGEKEIAMLAGNVDGHVGRSADVYECVHGGFRYCG